MTSSLRRSAALAAFSTSIVVACGSGDEAATTRPATSGNKSAVNHVLVTGQSNSVGFASKPPVSTRQPYSNLMFDVGVMTSGGCEAKGCRSYQEPTALVPLVEGDRYDLDPVETMCSGLANHVTELAGGDGKHDVLASVHGKSGYVYECLRKGSCDEALGAGFMDPFAEGMRQVKDAKKLVEASGRPYLVSAVAVVHGESDHYATTLPLDGTDGTKGAIKTYADALAEWQRDYETEIKAASGQKQGVPLFFSQIANWNDVPASDIPVQQLLAHTRGVSGQVGTKLVLVAPTYMLDYASDCIHFTAASNRRLGAYFAEAYARVVVQGKPWEPLRPIQVTRAGKLVTVKYAVPTPPLVVDIESVTDPGAYGFSYEDEGEDTPFIESVDQTAEDTITVTLSAEPTAAGKRLRYGQNAVPKTCPGPKEGPRGNVRDSAEATTTEGESLWNWSVVFDAPLD